MGYVPMLGLPGTLVQVAAPLTMPVVGLSSEDRMLASVRHAE